MSDTARDSIYRDVISSGRARDPLSPHCILPTRVRAASLPLSELLSSSGARKIASAPAAAERLDMDPAIFITGSEMAERYSPRKHPSLRWTVSRVIHRALAKFATDRLLRDTYGISDPSSMDFGARCCKRETEAETETETMRETEDGNYSQLAHRQAETRDALEGGSKSSEYRVMRIRSRILVSVRITETRCSEEKFGASHATRRRGRKRAECSNKTGNRTVGARIRKYEETQDFGTRNGRQFDRSIVRSFMGGGKEEGRDKRVLARLSRGRRRRFAAVAGSRDNYQSGNRLLLALSSSTSSRSVTFQRRKGLAMKGLVVPLRNPTHSLPLASRFSPLCSGRSIDPAPCFPFLLRALAASFSRARCFR